MTPDKMRGYHTVVPGWFPGFHHSFDTTAELLCFYSNLEEIYLKTFHVASSQNTVSFLNFSIEHSALWSRIPGAIREGIPGRTGIKIPLQWHINTRLKCQTDAFKTYPRSSVPDKLLRGGKTEWSTIAPFIHGDKAPRPPVDAWDLRELSILYILCAFLYLHTCLWWSLNNTLGSLIIK